MVVILQKTPKPRLGLLNSAAMSGELRHFNEQYFCRNYSGPQFRYELLRIQSDTAPSTKKQAAAFSHSFFQASSRSMFDILRKCTDCESGFPIVYLFLQIFSF